MVLVYLWDWSPPGGQILLRIMNHDHYFLESYELNTFKISKCLKNASCTILTRMRNAGLTGIPGISSGARSKSNMPSLTECASEFQSNPLLDTL